MVPGKDPPSRVKPTCCAGRAAIARTTARDVRCTGTSTRRMLPDRRKPTGARPRCGRGTAARPPTGYKPPMPIYTKTGDAGDTGLFGNRRVRKHDQRIEAYGTVDELNAALGLLTAEPLPARLAERIGKIQATLFEVGADLATIGGRKSVEKVAAATAELERWIDEDEAGL